MKNSRVFMTFTIALQMVLVPFAQAQNEITLDERVQRLERRNYTRANEEKIREQIQELEFELATLGAQYLTDKMFIRTFEEYTSEKQSTRAFLNLKQKYAQWIDGENMSKALPLAVVVGLFTGVGVIATKGRLRDGVKIAVGSIAVFVGLIAARMILDKKVDMLDEIETLSAEEAQIEVATRQKASLDAEIETQRLQALIDGLQSQLDENL